MHCFQLANLDTPIHKWTLPGVPEGVDVYIKRDDMTGSTLSGNKVGVLLSISDRHGLINCTFVN